MPRYSPLFLTRRAYGTRSYADAIDALNSLQTNYATLEALRKEPRKTQSTALPEMIEWFRRIGYVPADFDKLNIIHVTGTKGKGSTCAFTHSILAQYAPQVSKIGLYTSPHLKSVRERISINGAPLAEDLFTRYFFEVWDRLTETESDAAKFDDMGPGFKPVYFRFLTLLSFHVFLNEKVDAAIYEVGIGGEYDSTNVIQHPLAVGISNIGIDHERVLGSTLKEIAWNKAGIMKANTKAFTVEQKREAADELQSRADEKAVELVTVPVHPVVARSKLGIDADYQAVNASLSVALAREYLRRRNMLSTDTTSDAITLPEEFVRGLEAASWPGRSQVIKQGNIEWLLDGAHTSDSITVATKWFASKARPGARKMLIFNQQTRDAKALVGKLHSILGAEVSFDDVVFCTNVTWSSDEYQADLKSMNTSDKDVHDLVVQNQLADTWAELEPKSMRAVTPTIEDAVEYVRDIAKDACEDVQVLVTGSLHLVGGLLVVLDGRL
ncbi:Mur ligase [Limtongia smithiae]|uniref:Mur ligase n=1 Tax=Limtongia smithiae TaxID=1125753 RepID=UPI0034CF142F